jgi:UDP-glucuronate 4-epimerase
MKVLITGVAGFVGFHVASKLISKNFKVVGIDNLNNYYEVSLKKSRLKNILNNSNSKNFKFYLKDIRDQKAIKNIFFKEKPEVVIHLAAQAGVRYSLINPRLYMETNIMGFFNIIEESKKNNIKHFLYASSSSVYGANKKIPFSETDQASHPLQLYAATKRSDELIAHTYSYLYNLPTTGLRFFTVYGPWGRPDMSVFIFTKKILNREIIKISDGEIYRDYTYISDICECIFSLINKAPKKTSYAYKDFLPNNSSIAPYSIFNIGNNKPVKLTKLIKIIEEELKIKSKKKFFKKNSMDMNYTYADIDEIKSKFKFSNRTTIEEGIKNFVNWFKDYYKI